MYHGEKANKSLSHNQAQENVIAFNVIVVCKKRHEFQAVLQAFLMCFFFLTFFRHLKMLPKTAAIFLKTLCVKPM